MFCSVRRRVHVARHTATDILGIINKIAKTSNATTKAARCAKENFMQFARCSMGNEGNSFRTSQRMLERWTTKIAFPHMAGVCLRFVCLHFVGETICWSAMPCNSSSTHSSASSRSEIFTTIFHRLVWQALSLPRRVVGWVDGWMSQGIFHFTILYNLYVLVVVCVVLVVVVLNLAIKCL